MKMHYFFKKHSLLQGIDQTNKVYSKDDQEGSTKTVTDDPRGLGSVYLYVLSSTRSIYSTQIGVLIYKYELNYIVIKMQCLSSLTTKA